MVVVCTLQRAWSFSRNSQNCERSHSDFILHLVFSQWRADRTGCGKTRAILGRVIEKVCSWTLFEAPVAQHAVGLARKVTPYQLRSKLIGGGATWPGMRARSARAPPWACLRPYFTAPYEKRVDAMDMIYANCENR